MLQQFGMHTDLHQKADQCSLGELQRICVIRILLERRPLIAADESTAHLDRENQKSVENVLLSSENALVYIAHNYNREMMERFDRVIELKNGKIRTVTEVNDIETINRQTHSGIEWHI